jgi:hypothetical protein
MAQWFPDGAALCSFTLTILTKLLRILRHIATPPENPLRQLHSGCGQRIEYQKWRPKHGAVPLPSFNP